MPGKRDWLQLSGGLLLSGAVGLVAASAAEAAPTATQPPAATATSHLPTPDPHPALVVTASPAAAPAPVPLAVSSPSPVPLLASITGTVHDSGHPGQPLAQVPITLVGPSGPRLVARTDAAGRFSFASLAPGSYRVEVNPPRAYVVHGASQITLSLTGHNDAVLDVVMDQDLPELARSLNGTQPAWVPIDPYDLEHLAAIKQAADASSCHLPWSILAAIARVESNFGRDMSESSAGAIGYGQFLPSSWAVYGNGGDPYDYHDALPAMARYLCAAGAATDLRAALFAYNHADWYVDLVLDVASQLDHLAPDGPSADMLDAPIERGADSVHYAPGSGSLSVPFVGRGGDRTELGAMRQMLMLALHAVPPANTSPEQRAALEPPGTALDQLVANAPSAGLTALDLKTAQGQDRTWSIGDLRWHLSNGRPVALLVRARGLPGHVDADATAVQPILVVGLTDAGVQYNDPSFTTSLGAGLLMPVDMLQAAWLDQRAAAFAATRTLSGVDPATVSIAPWDLTPGPAPDRSDHPSAAQTAASDVSVPMPVDPAAILVPATAAPTDSAGALIAPEEAATAMPEPPAGPVVTAVPVSANTPAPALPASGIAAWPLLAGVLGLASAGAGAGTWLWRRRIGQHQHRGGSIPPEVVGDGLVPSR